MEDREGNTNLYEEQTPLQKLMEVYCDGRMDYDEFENKVKELYSDNEDSKPILKPFDIEEAKAGKPICTRGGRKARVICFDKKEGLPIVALIENENNVEEIMLYTIDGLAVSADCKSKFDLMMIPEKLEGWVNVYNDSPIYKTKEDAETAASTLRKLIATVKIELEE